jgi:hypothetical protein
MWFQMPRLENAYVDAALSWGAGTLGGSRRPSDSTTRQLHHSTYSGPEDNAKGLIWQMQETLSRLRDPA